ncbi:Bromodomain-containing protein [Fusarium flagelliforme]|uniref:Bromodomain-containing protein n=1 Tax=Fusarium flagelliforme TaxID=2675880 RepID=UPI001E8EC209|nr:Bromodomain-containing protein [Fusarium flagelliforme]KAH7179476.1 Bromodomain-containing protein [Fusarium flagelliforme]
MSEIRTQEAGAPIAKETESMKVEENKPFSWLEPHPTFVIILVGPEESPFGIQKDFLCSRSEFYEKHFSATNQDEKIEHIVKLPETTKEIFGLAQNFLYTERVISDESNVPSYEALVGLWKLGHKLGIKGLCDKALTAMIDCRRITETIPATPLLIQVWKDTPEGSSIRKLLLSWTAEYMRSSDARAEFAKSLPQEVLSELVVAMSSFDTVPTPEEQPAAVALPSVTPRKNVHYLEDEPDNEAKKSRRTSGTSVNTPLSADRSIKARGSLPKPASRRRTSAGFAEARDFTTAQKLEFCADLLTRMLSGPGFWTRLVGPFRDAVEPVEDGVPDYFEKVKRPMDLSTIKVKMDRKEYNDEEEFLRDVRQIFDNCFTYWKKGDPMWLAGEKLQKTFEDKFSHMNKWISKMGGDEVE